MGNRGEGPDGRAGAGRGSPVTRSISRRVVVVGSRPGGGDGVADQAAELLLVHRIQRGEPDAALPAADPAEPVDPGLGKVGAVTTAHTHRERCRSVASLS